jgi:hypothetical protein
VRPWRRFARCQVARLDEKPHSSVRLRRDGAAEVDVQPAQILTLLFSDPSRRRQR